MSAEPSFHDLAFMLLPLLCSGDRTDTPLTFLSGRWGSRWVTFCLGLVDFQSSESLVFRLHQSLHITFPSSAQESKWPLYQCSTHKCVHSFIQLLSTAFLPCTGYCPSSRDNTAQNKIPLLVAVAFQMGSQAVSRYFT